MLLKAENVTLGYEHSPVLTNVNFEISRGDYIVVIGENGAGKSTLIKALLGLIRPRNGSISLGELRRNQIGYLPQQTQVQRDFPASVREVVMSGCLNSMPFRPFYGKVQADRAERAMKRLDIWDMRARAYRSLSGGQQQRVLLARSLCAADSMLLVDEPVTGLDPEAAGEMYDVIRSLNAEGMTVIMISHDVGAALRDATHVYTVAGGTVITRTRDEYTKEHANDAIVA